MTLSRCIGTVDRSCLAMGFWHALMPSEKGSERKEFRLSRNKLHSKRDISSTDHKITTIEDIAVSQVIWIYSSSRNAARCRPSSTTFDAGFPDTQVILERP